MSTIRSSTQLVKRLRCYDTILKRNGYPVFEILFRVGNFGGGGGGGGYVCLSFIRQSYQAQIRSTLQKSIKKQLC